MTRPLTLLLALSLPAAGLASESARQVLPSGAGPQRLEPDAALVAASARGDLGDLRLRDAAGKEVPHLLVAPSAPAGRWTRARILPVLATKKESGFEADLGAARTVSRLRLEGLREPFLKRFRLEGSGDREHWTVLVPEGTLFALPDERLRQTEVAFEAGPYRYLRVTWDDRSSARLGEPRAVTAWEPAAGVVSPAPLSVPLGVARRESEPGVSRWALRLPGPHLPVAFIVLDVGGGHVLRNAVVSEARLGEGRLEPVRLGSAELRRVMRDGMEASSLRVPVVRPEELELELVVEDGENPPLELRAVSAELTPLPWVFFESADGAPLQATVGDPARTEPRFDLEVLRPRLAELRAGAARLSAASSAVIEPSAPPIPSPDLAQGGPVDAGAFRYRRAVPAAEPGLTALRLDAPVLSRSPGLGDLRIVGASARQIPYLLERRDEPIGIPLAAPAPASAPKLARGGATLHAVELPEPSLPDARLVLTTSARVFEREVEVYADDDGKRHTPPRLVASARWTHAIPERPAPQLTLSLPSIESRRLIVVVDDGDNAPLPLTSARLLLPSYRLRFFHPGGPLQLLFGARDVGAPRYDLALLAPRLRAAPARELELATGAADAGPAAEPGQQGKVAFWIVLAVAVAALLGLLAKLLGKGGAGAPPPAAGA